MKRTKKIIIVLLLTFVFGTILTGCTNIKPEGDDNNCKINEISKGDCD